MRRRNPALLLFYSGPDSTSQRSARFPLHQSRVPGPFPELPEQPPLPEQESHQQPDHMVKWLLITHRKIVPNRCLSTVVFTRHRTVVPCCAVYLWHFASVVLSLHLLPWEGPRAPLLPAVSLSHQYILTSWNVFLLQSTKVPRYLHSGNCWLL